MFAEFGTGQVFWSLLYFYLFFIWIWLLIRIFGDIFRSQDLGGWSKALWCFFVIVLPFLGVFVYLISRGRQMNEHDIEAVQAQEEAFRGYVRNEVAAVNSGSSDADQLAKLASLKADGVIDEAEFTALKAKVTAA